jgi:hypothetical protein
MPLGCPLTPAVASGCCEFKRPFTLKTEYAKTLVCLCQTLAFACQTTRRSAAKCQAVTGKSISSLVVYKGDPLRLLTTPFEAVLAGGARRAWRGAPRSGDGGLRGERSG